MSDYTTDTGILRGQMGYMLANNAEQFIFVLSNALAQVDILQAIDEGEIGDETNAQDTIDSLRQLANAIEQGLVAS